MTTTPTDTPVQRSDVNLVTVEALSALDDRRIGYTIVASDADGTILRFDHTQLDALAAGLEGSQCTRSHW